jgi:hypothetical protein
MWGSDGLQRELKKRDGFFAGAQKDTEKLALEGVILSNAQSPCASRFDTHSYS